MQKQYTIHFWNQDPKINDCKGNRSRWTGKARSLANALEKASKYQAFFRVHSVEVRELEKNTSGAVETTSEYTIFRKDLSASFKREYATNGAWTWEVIQKENLKISLID